MTKKYARAIEDIDSRPLISSNVTHETKPLDIILDSRQNTTVVNIIRAPL